MVREVQDAETHEDTTGVATILAALILAAPAQASTAADDQYGAVLGEQGGGGDVQGAGSLPFTGLSLVLLGGVGVALTAGGVLIRRVAGPSSRQRPSGALCGGSAPPA